MDGMVDEPEVVVRLLNPGAQGRLFSCECWKGVLDEEMIMVRLLNLEVRGGTLVMGVGWA